MQFAKHIAAKIDGSQSTSDDDVSVSDGLNTEVWPLYPEIADQMSLPGGSYVWRAEGRYYSGISAFLEFSYDQYGQEVVDRDDLEIDGDESIFDHVLGPQVGLGR